MSANVIEVRDLSYRYPDGTLALQNVDFNLGAADSVALLGPNGSGKTTFTLCLNGLLRGKGSVRICGEELNEDTVRIARRHVGMVFQDADDQLFLPTVLEDVMFGPLNMGLDREAARARSLAALRAMHLEDKGDRPPWRLSAGEKRRAAIAGVLATDPVVLVLDEPTTSLDPPGRKELIAILKSLGQARIVVTHDAGLARSIAERAVFFQQGKIVAEGFVEDLLRRFDWE